MEKQNREKGALRDFLLFTPTVSGVVGDTKKYEGKITEPHFPIRLGRQDEVLALKHS